MNMLSHFNRVICTMIHLREKMELDNVLCILYQFLSSFFLKDRFLSEYRAGKGPILLGAEFVGAELSSIPTEYNIGTGFYPRH